MPFCHSYMYMYEYKHEYKVMLPLFPIILEFDVHLLLEADEMETDLTPFLSKCHALLYLLLNSPCPMVTFHLLELLLPFFCSFFNNCVVLYM